MNNLASFHAVFCYCFNIVSMQRTYCFQWRLRKKKASTKIILIDNTIKMKLQLWCFFFSQKLWKQINLSIIRSDTNWIWFSKRTRDILLFDTHDHQENLIKAKKFIWEWWNYSWLYRYMYFVPNRWATDLTMYWNLTMIIMCFAAKLQRKYNNKNWKIFNIRE